ncbi:acyl carrier protein [Flindersiella endophytica]
MTVDEAFTAVREALQRIAPDVDAEHLESGTRLREDLELDSLDFEGFIVQLSERSGHTIAEDDYPLLSSVGDCETYLVKHS